MGKAGTRVWQDTNTDWTEILHKITYFNLQDLDSLMGQDTCVQAYRMFCILTPERSDVFTRHIMRETFDLMASLHLEA